MEEEKQAKDCTFRPLLAADHRKSKVHTPYRGTSLIRNTHPHRIAIGP